MHKWRCTLCGYVYDPEEGDDDSDVEPGTPFDDLPADWVCPDCGASREEFEELELDEDEDDDLDLDDE
ncbi:rubredoxin [bacterium]|nr:rubredoxin [bacterium]